MTDLTKLRLIAIKVSLCSFSIFPLLPGTLKGFPVIIFFVMSLWIFSKSDFKPTFNSTYVSLSSLFLISLLSIFYSGSTIFPYYKVETILSLIVIPASFWALDIRKVHFKIIKFFFTGFVICTSILSLTSLFFYYSKNLFSRDFFKVNTFRNLTFELPIVNDHPTYISIYLGLSLIIILAFFKTLKTQHKFITCICFAINAVHILLLSSKGVIISLIVTFIIIIFLRTKKTLQNLTFSAIFLSFIAVILVLNPNTERRFKEIFIESTYSELHTSNSTSIRAAIYKCAIDAIAQKPFLGYGLGQGDNALISCYADKSNFLFKRQFNSHNQYFGYWLDGGIIALIVLVTFIIMRIKTALKYSNDLYLTITIFFALLMLVENFLNRQSGLILFIFFMTLFETTRIKELEN